MSKYPKLGSKTEQEKEKEENFFADYPELTDAIANNEELGTCGLGLYISGYFYEKDSKLEKMDQHENGTADKDSVEAPYEIYNNSEMDSFLMQENKKVINYIFMPLFN